MGDIPDVDLSVLGVTDHGTFSVEVVDPVSDYLELLEVSYLKYGYLSSHRIIILFHIIDCFLRFSAECI